MTIGLLTPYFPDALTVNSGLANHFSTLAKALEKAGHTIVVIHVRPCYAEDPESGLVKKQQPGEGITVLTIKVALRRPAIKIAGKRWALIDFLLKLKCINVTRKHLKQVVEEYRLDIIETTSYFALAYLYLFTNPAIPVVIRVSTTYSQILNDYYPFQSRLLKQIGALELMLIRKSKFLITHAHGHAQELENRYHIKQERFTIVPHGIRLPDRSNLTASAGCPSKILYVGRLEYRKGTDILLNAIPLVLNRHPGAHFELVGSDPENSYELAFRNENDEQVNQQVVFSGQLDNGRMDQAYADCDIFVAPSRYESFGLIYIEAMSFGKPVIGFNVGGVSEIIEDAVNGLYADFEDAASLAEKINYLLDNAAMRKIMGSNARKTVEEKFSDTILAANSAAYYQWAIANKNKS